MYVYKNQLTHGVLYVNGQYYIQDIVVYSIVSRSKWQGSRYLGNKEEKEKNKLMIIFFTSISLTLQCRVFCTLLMDIMELQIIA